jgi:hypothetical protein
LLLLHSITLPAFEEEFEALEEFDEALLSAIDAILRFAPGDACKQIICHYLQRTSFPKSEIPKRLDGFSEEFKNL